MVVVVALAVGCGQAAARNVTVAAASDLKFALAEVVNAFAAARPDSKIEVIYGSSGKFFTQISNGAPFDLFFSADIAYPRELESKGLTMGPPRTYATGRIVLWSLRSEFARTALKNLPASPIRRLAIANPEHAPYGRGARQALEHEGVWDALRPQLVLGDNIAHTAQFVESGAADAGIIALSLALAPPMKSRGSYVLVPQDWHRPLEQGYVVLARARDNPRVKEFADFLAGPAARAILRAYGFALPEEEEK